MKIERTLWQLKLPGRVAMPAARAFEKMLLDRSAFPGEKWLGPLSRDGLLRSVALPTSKAGAAG